jgi:hypothetical protein
MDLSLNDFDMSECCAGHTFCNCHAENLQIAKLTPEDLRAAIHDKIANHRYWDAARKETKYIELSEIDDDGLEDYNSEEFGDDGVGANECPICSFTNISDGDGFAYLKVKLGFTNETLLREIKMKFKSYGEFSKFLKSAGV